MYGTYSRAAELVGFALLIAAVLWDWRMRSSALTVESAVSWIEATDLAHRLVQKPPPLVIDVRGRDEFNGELGHIKDARNISFAEFPQRIGELDRREADEVVLVCRTQMRSAKAATILREAGFSDVAVLRGGMVEWVRQNRPVERAAATLV